MRRVFGLGLVHMILWSMIPACRVWCLFFTMTILLDHALLLPGAFLGCMSSRCYVLVRRCVLQPLLPRKTHFFWETDGDKFLAIFIFEISSNFSILILD